MSVEVKLELGHKASLREKPTPEGFTHNWTVFVKGCDGSNICHFVDKVVFHLHESFPKPKRVVKEPPYQVVECGYAGFMMPIEVYFRSKEEPKKVRFEYDLYLRLEGLPVHNIRLEKLTFQNPSEDFRRKLLKARSDRSLSSTSSGGIGLPTLAVAPLQHSEEPRPLAHVKPVAAIAEKKARNHTASKEPSKPAPPVTKPSQPFNDIFGTPIKPKHSPEPSTKSKETSHSNHQKPNKLLPPVISPVGIVASKDPKSTTKEAHSGEVKEAKPKVPKVEKEQKSAIKRSHATPDESQHALSEKKRKHNSSSSNSGKPADGAKVKEEKEKKDKHKSKSNLMGKKEKHKSTSQHKESSKSPKVNNNHKLPLPEVLPHSADSNDMKGASLKVQENISDPPSTTPSDPPDETYHTISPLPMETEFISPLSSEEDSPQPSKEKLQLANHNTESNHSFQDEQVAKTCSKSDALKPKSTLKPKTQVKKHRGKQNGASKENQPSPSGERSPRTLDVVYHQELVDLQKRIMSLNDQQQLQRIVDVIEKTGKFHVTSSSFDFDLCSLDQNTVRQLKSCLSM